MASLAPAALPQMPPPQQPPSRGPQFISRDRIQAMLLKLNQLKQQGHTEATSPEMAQIINVMKALNQAQQDRQKHFKAQQASMPHENGAGPSVPRSLNGTPAPDAPTPTSTSMSTDHLTIDPNMPPPNPMPPSSPAPVTFTPNQLTTLRAQLQAFKYLSSNLPIPAPLQQAIYSPEKAISSLEKQLDGPDVTSRVVDNAVQVHKAVEQIEDTDKKVEAKVEGEQADAPAKPETPKEPELIVPEGRLLEEDKTSPIYPYNAVTHPFTLVRKPAQSLSALQATKLQRTLVPSIMPVGLDPYQLLAERNRFLDARIANRIRELSALPSTMGDGGLEHPMPLTDKENDDSAKAHGKLKALIELKSLKLRDKQRTLRAAIVHRLSDASALTADRKEFRRFRKQTLRDARNTEQLERKQRQERDRRAKQKHLDYLMTICNHGKDMIAANRTAVARMQKLGKSVLKFHVDTEKEEQKRIERISKERLKALKADDEEAYMKLIDTAKDTRITHLLRQTDSYLDSLAQAVMEQQNDDEHRDPHVRNFATIEGPADETTFGAMRPDDEPISDDKKIDYYAVAHKIQEKITAQPSILVGGTLKEYQIKGLQWMVSLYNNRLNGILADEMGLGKTIQTISLITFLIERKKQIGPYLVIVPLSTLTNWTLEFSKWAPSVSCLVYKGSPAMRRTLATQIRQGGFQVLMTTYEYIIKDKAVLGRVKWVHMIIDEGHRMKNTQSRLSQTLTQQYSSRYRLILTGTPLQNNLPELWALLNFVLPKIFNSVKSFDEWFNTPFANTGSQDKIELNEEESLLIIRRLHKVLRPFLLRRLKKDVEKELPDKVEKVIKCKMSALQSQLYMQMKRHGMLFEDSKDPKGKQAGIKGLNNTIMQFRKICQHPFVFPEVENKINPTMNVGSSIIRVAGKVALLDRLLPKLFATGHRVLMFFQMTHVMDIVADYLNYRNYLHLRLDGTTKPDERSNLLATFNAPGSPYSIFMLSTRAGGLGLNLQTADTVIIYDSDWNPHADLQAQDRAHRIGQKNAVRIFRFVTEKSIEEAMLARAKSKLDMDGKVIQAGRFDNKSTAEEREDYLRSMLEADNDEDTDESASMNDDEINEIVARDDNEMEIFRRMDIDREREEEDQWRASGGRGPKPDRLMQLHELPEVYQQDEPLQPDVEEEVTGRGQRVRTAVRYNDGLTDEQWVNAIEDDEIDVDDLIEEKRIRKERRMANKSQRDMEPSSPEATPEPPTKAQKARGRGKGKGKAKAEPESFMKRKRGGKSMSVTPSVVDDEDDEPQSSKRRKTSSASANGALTPAIRERMKKAFNECHKAVATCTDDTGRKRCELFRELPSKKDYPDYYQTIQTPISMAQLRKRATSNYYKTVSAYRDDWTLMFNNARRYNQEGSWVYVDAEEMQKVFEAVFARETVGSGLPGAEAGGYSPAGSGDAQSPMDEDEEPVKRTKGRPRKKPVDQDYSDDDFSDD